MLEGVLQTIFLLCLKALIRIRLFLRGDTRVDNGISLAQLCIVGLLCLSQMTGLVGIDSCELISGFSQVGEKDHG